MFKETTMHAIVSKLRDIKQLPSYVSMSSKLKKAFVAKLYDFMTSNESLNKSAERLKELVKENSPKDLDEFINEYFKQYEKNRKNVLAAQPFLELSSKNSQKSHHHDESGVHQNNHSQRGNNNKRVKVNHDNNNNKNNKNSDQSPQLCAGCGRSHSGTCSLAGQHPDFNTEPHPWSESTKGKAWAGRMNNYYNEPHKVLPWTLTLNSTPWDAPHNPKNRGNNHDSNKNSKKPQNKPRKLNLCLNNLTENITSNKLNTNTYTLPCIIQVETNKLNKNIHANTLIDTGALQGNYISKTLANTLSGVGVCINNNKIHVVCSAVGDCNNYVEELNLKINLKVVDKKNNKNCNCLKQNFIYKTILLTCIIIDSHLDIIIGLPTIKQYNLLHDLE